MSSLCGIFVYKDVMSMVTNRELIGMFRFSTSVMN